MPYEPTVGLPALTVRPLLLIAETPAPCVQIFRHPDGGRSLVSGATKFDLFSVREYLFTLEPPCWNT